MTLEMALTIFGPMIGIFGIFSALVLWMMSRIETRMHNDIKAIADDSNTKWMAVNSRIDQTQSIIMRMLENQGR